jgi:hypothetical protein
VLGKPGKNENELFQRGKITPKGYYYTASYQIRQSGGFVILVIYDLFTAQSCDTF